MSKTNSMIVLRAAACDDAAKVAAIYNHYVETSAITFEEVPIEVEEMARRMGEVFSKSLPWYVAIEGETIVGYAYATPWRARSAYRFSVEVTVYLSQEHVRKGTGTRLYRALLDSLRNSGFRTAIAVIALPNPKSIALHERLGFIKTAHLKQVGFKFESWIDVGYWQLLLRSDDEQV